MEKVKMEDFGMAKAKLEKEKVVMVMEGSGIEVKEAMGKSTWKSSKKLPTPASYFHIT